MQSVIIIVTAVVSAAAVFTAAVAKILSNHEFECKKCGYKARFDWKKLLFVIHDENEYYIKCPNCGNDKMTMTEK